MILNIDVPLAAPNKDDPLSVADDATDFDVSIVEWIVFETVSTITKKYITSESNDLSISKTTLYL